MSAQFWNGVRVFVSPRAETVRVWHEVRRWSTRQKRRRNWRVVRCEKREPAAYRSEMGLIVHPTIWEAMRRAA
jgi:hypothetical protein